MNTRLMLGTPLSREQEMVTKHLMDSPGLCACGRTLKVFDPKFVLGQINSFYAPVKDAQNTLIIAIYCSDCFVRINSLFHKLRNSYHAVQP